MTLEPIQRGGRRYYPCPEHPGAEYVSVTTALKIGSEPYYPAGAADHGNAMHSALERLLSGVDWREPDGEYPLTDALWAGMEQLERWWPHAGLTVRLVERTIYHHGQQYAGRLDALVADADGELYVVDLKTQREPDPAKWRLQLAAYAAAEQWADEAGALAPMPAVTRGLVLWVPKANPNGWAPITYDIGPVAQEAWLHVLAADRGLEQDPDPGTLMTVWSLGGNVA